MNRPSVGAAILLVDIYSGRFLAGLRNDPSKPGYLTWGLPGGHVEGGERAEAAVRRELREEAGIELEPGIMARSSYTDADCDGKHYITLHFLAYVDADPGKVQPKVMEPDKMAMWLWMPWGVAERSRYPLFPLLAPVFRKYSSAKLMPVLETGL